MSKNFVKEILNKRVLFETAFISIEWKIKIMLYSTIEYNDDTFIKVSYDDFLSKIEEAHIFTKVEI